MADESLEQLLAKARGIAMTPVQAEAQRRSFAFGNVSISNPLVTRAMIDEAAERLAMHPPLPRSPTR